MQALRRVRVEKDIIVRIYRTLPSQGKLVVKVRQEVTPDEIIGQSEFSSGFTTLNLADLLKVSPEDVEKNLKKMLGQRIYKGELLAYKSAWLFKRAKIVTCPVDGILDFINKKTGEIRITRMPKKVNLPSGVYGIIESLDSDKGQIVIKTQVSRIWGVCGSGRVRDGTLKILSRREELTAKGAILPKHEGAILVNGGLISKESIMTAISNEVNGIITGGINCADYKSVAGGKLVFPKKLENDIGVSILVCEGFGSEPLGEDIYGLLQEYEERFVQIDGNHSFLLLPSYTSDSMNRVRKTELKKIGNDENFLENQLIELQLGQKVRVVGSSFSAEQGKITAIDKSQTKLPSGIWAYLTTLETRRRKFKIPVNNLEVI